VLNIRKEDMTAKKTEKVPYQEYRKLKEQAAKKRFKFSFYPMPVLLCLLLPFAIFILAMLWYFMNVNNFLE
jgi:hypothetical protein